MVFPNAPTQTGNRATAEQYADVLRAAGHGVSMDVDAAPPQPPDVVVALHAAKSRDRVRTLRAAYPRATLVVVLTGTDLYPVLPAEAREALEWADRIVALQRHARDRVPAALRSRVRILVQAARMRPASVPTRADAFEICCIGNLRAIKDPLRPALAARALPPTSRIRVAHVGAVLEPAYEELVAAERRENPRYEWLGARSQLEVAEILERSRVSVVPSYHEGGARVIGESAVLGTPILAARNDASRALLGEDYAGLYTAGSTEELTALMTRTENDRAFFATLDEQTRRAAPQFFEEREREGWRALLAECEDLPARRRAARVPRASGDER